MSAEAPTLAPPVQEGQQKEAYQTGQQLPSWQAVPELFEQRSPEFSALRGKVLTDMQSERIGRLATNPEKTEEEVSAGVMREQLEPQCRDAVFAMREKGYETFSSGFGVGDLQVLDGVFDNMTRETSELLTQYGYLVYETEPGNVGLAFKPERPDINEMTSRWNQLADLLPDLGHQATHSEAAEQRFFAGVQVPGQYGYEMAIRLEDNQVVIDQPAQPADSSSETAIELPPDVDPNLIKKETDPATINAQIERGLSEEGIFRFLNNFEHHLPGGWDDANLQKYPELADQLKVDPGYTKEDLEDMLTYPEPWPTAKDRAYHSERYLVATNASMQADVAHVVTSTAGVDPAKLESLRKAYFDKRAASSVRSAPEERTAYLTYALPIYRALRERGYSHYDLWT